MTADELLPDFDARSEHGTHVAAPPERVADAVASVRTRDLPLTAVLMAMRTLLERRSVPDEPLLRTMEHNGFRVLAHTEREVVIAIAGRFWALRPDIAQLRTAADFASFDRPGSARGLMTIAWRPEGAGTELRTETRVQATDDPARRTFLRYWRLISPGSGLIRHEMLRAIQRRAEH